MIFVFLVSLLADEAEVPTSKESLPKLIFRVDPKYPSIVEKEGIAGRVLLELQLDAKGTVISAKVLGGLHPAIDDAAIEAVKQFRFTPYIDQEGLAVPSIIQYQVEFFAKKLR